MSLKELALDLDYEVVKIGIKVETLSDLQQYLGRLREDMEKIDVKDAAFHFREFFWKVRILDDLMSYTINDLSSVYEKTDQVKKTLFENIVNGVEE